MTYVRIHLAIYVFFQRIEIIPFNHWLPSWRFFVPGSSLSPISLPPPPASLRPGSLLPWLGACALGTAPFLCFYLSSRVHANLAKNLRDAIYKHLPRPDNSFLRRQTWAGLRLGTPNSPADPRADEGVSTSPTGPPPLRRQSTVSLRGSGINNDPTTTTTATTTAPDPSHHRRQSQSQDQSYSQQPSQPSGSGGGGSVDEFGSDDEETEIISATLISFDVEAADPTTPGASGPGGSSNPTGGPNGAAGGDTTPGIWSAELRPNIPDNSRSSGYGFPTDGSGEGATYGGDGTGGDDDDAAAAASAAAAAGSTGNGSLNRPESVYRENAFTALPARLAANILALTPARLMAMPMTVAVHVFLARSYMRRMGMSLDIVNTGAGLWFGMQSARGLVNLLGLELLLGVLQAESWAAIMLVANRWRYTEEEWTVREIDEAIDLIVAERREERAALAAEGN